VLETVKDVFEQAGAFIRNGLDHDVQILHGRRGVALLRDCNDLEQVTTSAEASYLVPYLSYITRGELFGLEEHTMSKAVPNCWSVG
jgi:hypothetical protein